MEGGKRKLNPFFKFRKAKYEEVKKKYPKASVVELAKKLGEMYRALTPAEKKKYE